MGPLPTTQKSLNTHRLPLKNPLGVEHVGAATHRGPERIEGPSASQARSHPCQRLQSLLESASGPAETIIKG